jgi:hypothetical protein
MPSRTITSTSRTCDVAIAGAIFNILHLHLSMISAPQRPYPAVCGARTGWAWGNFQRFGALEAAVLAS